MKKDERMKILRARMFFVFGVIIAALLIVLLITGISRRQSRSASGDTETVAAETGKENAVSESAAGEDGAETAEEEPSEGGSSALAASPVDPTATVKISAVGDCTLGTDTKYVYKGSFPAKYEEVQDPDYFFRNVYDIFTDDDLSIVNIEQVFTDDTSHREDKEYAYYGEPEYVDILARSSVEAANLANNHSHDYGEDSYTDTIQYLEAAGIPTFGYERTQILNINGVKVGLTGTYELRDGMGCEDDLLAAIQDVKDQGAELIICTFHWGKMRVNYPTDNQVKLAHIAIDNGADLVLGHHAHVIQGIERYHGKNIVYGLGNFCYGGNYNPEDKDTMIFQQTFTIENGEVVIDDNSEVIPCSLSSVTERNNFQPTPLTGEDAQRVLDRIEKYSEKLSTEPDPVGQGAETETEQTGTEGTGTEETET